MDIRQHGHDAVVESPDDVTVRCGFCDPLGANEPGGPGHILNDDGLPHVVGHLLGDDARGVVHGARGLQRHDHQDGLAGIADLRKEGRGMAREQEGDQ